MKRILMALVFTLLGVQAAYATIITNGSFETGDSTLRLLLMKAGELSSDENEQIYNFAMMFCNVWFSVQIAYDSGQIDKGLYAAGLKDVRVEMDRWPNFRSAIQQWLDNYPENAQHEIFQPVITRTS